jgi:hypothetical protein
MTHLAVPTVHNNGTSRKALTDSLSNAYAKIGEAIEALSQCAPHRRDYYVQNTGSFEAAQAEHITRMNLLHTARNEVLQIHGAIS